MIDYPKNGLPEYVVDLNDAPSVRLRNVTTNEAAKCVALRNNYFDQMAMTIGWAPLSAITAAMSAAIPMLTYRNEMREWARATSLSIRDIAALNYAYELTNTMGGIGCACTSAAYRTRKGVYRHVRTMDWPIHGMGYGTIEINYKNARAGDFTAWTWPGYCGVASGIAPGRFSITLNQGAHYGSMFSLATGMAPTVLIRKILETAHDFDEAIEMIENTHTSTSALIMVCGINDAAVVERLPHECEIRYATNEDSKVVCANHYIEYDIDVEQDGWLQFSLKRYSAMSASTKRRHSMEGTLNALKYPLIHEDNRQIMVMEPAAGDYVISLHEEYDNDE